MADGTPSLDDPLVVEFEVGVAPDQAFEVWTRRCSMWWPRAHTVSGDPAAISFESHPGGRIVERGRDGAEHDWGKVLDWEPPSRLRYLWHLFFDASEATEVELTFTAVPAGTAVRLEQRGWDKLGETDPPATPAASGRARCGAGSPPSTRARARARARHRADSGRHRLAAAIRSGAGDQLGGGVLPVCLIVTVPVLSG